MEYGVTNNGVVRTLLNVNMIEKDLCLITQCGAFDVSFWPTELRTIAGATSSWAA